MSLAAAPRRRPLGFAWPTRLGWMAAVWSESGLCRLSFGWKSLRELEIALHGAATSDRAAAIHGDAAGDLAARLADFADGADEDFSDIPLDLSAAAPFRRAVVEACRRVAWGQTSTYGDLAAAAGRPRAARAVGRVMATNPTPLVVPCHRILGAGGALGGYSAAGGLSLKQRLLAAERAAGPPRARRSKALATVGRAGSYV